MTPTTQTRPSRSPRAVKTTLVGAELPPEYAQKMRDLHAWTGLLKREILMEAIDRLHSEHQPKPQQGGQTQP
ncbi:hypothetical protein [Microvirga sesbaniae]|uniref:hypothetical protein n=1 Tax=Microvirga sesbaniae TaxID=681392 RepID=UPI0021C94DC9|nr:hypothetical protein [Microvirga sp. HBU67692]